MPIVERVTEGCVLGEAPHWDIPSQTLYFVDIAGKSILKFVPEKKQVTKTSLAPLQPSFIIPIESAPNRFILGLDNHLTFISWDGTTIGKQEILTTVERSPEAPGTSFNDAKCDSSGRLWAGTQSLDPEIQKTQPLGALYSHEGKGKKLQKQIDGVRIANGLAFNEKAGQMFYIDSLAGSVDRFDFDVKGGKISNRQAWFTLKKHDVPGMADGMTIDTDGHLWVAVFGGGRVLKVDGGKKETLLDTVILPAEQVTSACFGGRDLDELFVTTAALELEGRKLLPPENGATYKITGTGSKGLPSPNFRFE